MKEIILSSIPISWLCKSEKVRSHIQSITDDTNSPSEVVIADFAAGENDEVPVFFHRLLRSCMDFTDPISMRVYCTDLHTLRIESLFDKLQEEDLIETTRVILSKFESMTKEAIFPEIQNEFLKDNSANLSKLDQYILAEKALPRSCFDIGILNNDVIGYIHEYYKEYTDAEQSIEGIKSVMKSKSLLVVTQPCLLYPIDNIEVLHGHGFQFIEGYDIETESGALTTVDEGTNPKSMSRLGHYTVLIFESP